MHFEVNGHRLYAYSAGKPLVDGQPTVVFIHGVLNDHSVWALQSRHFAYNGWNVLAINLPGHARSGGPPPANVQDAAATIIALLDAAGVESAALVGHSFGSLIAMETAAQAPDRVSYVALAGTASPMRVAPALLENSLNAPEKAIHMVNVFSHSTLCPPPSSLGPGTWVSGASRALMRRVLASNTQTNVFHAGFTACDQYAGGDEAIDTISCPLLFLIGRHDRMTPPKSARALAGRAQHARTVEVDAGHAMMTEAPGPVLDALRDFLLT